MSKVNIRHGKRVYPPWSYPQITIHINCSIDPEVIALLVGKISRAVK